MAFCYIFENKKNNYLLLYYNTKNNKLLKIVDAISADNKLGDFYNGSSGSGNDYVYDDNGNLISDANKNISSITYNSPSYR